jgi:hypothetical protein
VCAALETFGLADRAAQIDPEIWARTGATLRLGEIPEQIDILLQLSGVSYDAITARAVAYTYAGVAVRFIGLDDLIANKRTAGRAKDLADVEALERARTEDAE